jgi:DNA replication protein DnaC
MARFPSGRPRPLPSADPRDLAYFTKDQAETSVLFELIASYERRSMLVTANQPFGDWGKVFPDPMAS